MHKVVRICAFVLMLSLLAEAATLVTGTTKMKYEPGDKVLFATDFRECPVGEFPEGFDKFEKAVECVKYEEHIWIAHPADKGYRLWKRLALGKRDFSLEYDLLSDPQAKKNFYPRVKVRILKQGKDEKEWNNENYWGDEKYDVDFYGDRFVVHGVGDTAHVKKRPQSKYHVAIQVRRHQFRLFLNGKRIASIPFDAQNGVHGFEIKVWDTPPYGVLISNIKVATYSKKEAKPTPEKLGIGVQKTDEGYKLTMPEKVLFDFNQFALKPESKEALASVAAFIAEHPAKKLIVTGYTDNVGSDEYNLKLSLQRAQSVADYLIYCEKVDPKLFKIVGKGKAEPVASNDTEAGRAKNRRVELRLLK